MQVSQLSIAPLYFRPSLTLQDGHMMYMGKDKHENEDLIRYGIPEDVWFHVDNLSSAHVYLRMNRGEKVQTTADIRKTYRHVHYVLRVIA